MSSTVFVIMNESVLRGSEIPQVEPVMPFHWSLNSALSALAEIAEDAGVDLDPDDNSVQLPVDNTPYVSDEYWIEEVEVVGEVE